MYPSQVIDLTNWKLQLPVGESEKPEEVLDLRNYERRPYFYALSDAEVVVFQAPVEGVTTSGSSYPRSELREMIDGAKASWSTSEGYHRMRLKQAISVVPPKKPHVVAGQIHDADDDVVMIRLEGKRLFVEVGGDEVALLNPDYRLGSLFEIMFAAGMSKISIWYNGQIVYQLPIKTDGCYFKAGCYTQSNLSKGDVKGAYGEVRIMELEVYHAAKDLGLPPTPPVEDRILSRESLLQISSNLEAVIEHLKAIVVELK